GDLAFPLAAAEPDLLLPGHLVAALRLDAQHPVHELREIVEVRPPFVHHVERRRDVRPPLNRQSARLPARLAAAAGLSYAFLQRVGRLPRRVRRREAAEPRSCGTDDLLQIAVLL